MSTEGQRVRIVVRGRISGEKGEELTVTAQADRLVGVVDVPGKIDFTGGDRAGQVGYRCQLVKHGAGGGSTGGVLRLHRSGQLVCVVAGICSGIDVGTGITIEAGQFFTVPLQQQGTVGVVVGPGDGDQTGSGAAGKTGHVGEHSGSGARSGAGITADGVGHAVIVGARSRGVGEHRHSTTDGGDDSSIACHCLSLTRCRKGPGQGDGVVEGAGGEVHRHGRNFEATTGRITFDTATGCHQGVGTGSINDSGIMVAGGISRKNLEKGAIAADDDAFVGVTIGPRQVGLSGSHGATEVTRCRKEVVDGAAVISADAGRGLTTEGVGTQTHRGAAVGVAGICSGQDRQQGSIALYDQTVVSVVVGP